MGRKRKCRSVLLCGLDEHLLRQIDGKFGSQSSVIIKSLGGYLEALSPGLLLEVACLNLEYFWHPKGLAIKFRKSLEVKISLESFNADRFLSMVEGLLQHQFVRKSNLGLNLYRSIPYKSKGPPQNCLRLGDRAKCCQKLNPSLLELSKMEVFPEKSNLKSKGANENQS